MGRIFTIQTPCCQQPMDSDEWYECVSEYGECSICETPIEAHGLMSAATSPVPDVTDLLKARLREAVAEKFQGTDEELDRAVDALFEFATRLGNEIGHTTPKEEQ